jgi:hypothetical protein
LCCTGYQFNVQFLRYFLAPVYEVHEVRQAGDNDILVKWSWTMNFWWNRYNPLKFIWDPRLVFSGISILGYNPNTGCFHPLLPDQLLPDQALAGICSRGS